MIRLKGINKVYKGTQEVIGLDEFSLDLPRAGLCFLVGKSGSGKTTLLNIVGGLDHSDSGTIEIQEQKVSDFKEKEWDEFRNRHIGIVFQNFNLFENMNVYDNLAFPLKLQNYKKEEINQHVEEVLEYVDLKGYETRKITELSTGQKQRIAIARALIKEPDIILADEPTGNLDEKNSQSVFEVLQNISKKCMVLVITHDEEAAFQYGDRIVRIRDGKKIDDITNDRKKAFLDGIKQVTVKDDVTNHEKTYKTLEEFNLKKSTLEITENDIEKIAENNNQIEYKITLTFGTNREDVLENNFEETKNNRKKYSANEMKMPKMKMRDIMYLALQNFEKRKLRLFFTFVCLVISAVLCMITGVFLKNDSKLSLEEYLGNNKIDKIFLKKETSYEKSDKTVQEATIKKGEKFYKELTQIVEENQIIPIIEDMDVRYINEQNIEKQIYTTVYVGKDTQENIFGELSGNFPRKYNEILITDYLAEQLNIGEEIVGKKIMVGDDTFIVSGSIITNYKNEKKHENLMLTNKEYNRIVISEQFFRMKENKEEIVYLNASNPYYAGGVKNFTEMSAGYGSTAWCSEEDLVWGRMPQKENEIIVQLGLAIQMGYAANNNDFMKDYRLPDLREKKYNQSYDEYINLYEYFQNGMEIVGIYQNLKDNEEKEGEILVDNHIYEELKREQYRYYYFDAFSLDISAGNYHNIVKEIDTRNFILDHNDVIYVYSFENILEEMKELLLFALFIFVILGLFMIVSYIAYNIKDHSKKIGILRAIGVFHRDIIKIFLVESGIISIGSVIVAIVSMCGLVYGLNQKIGEMISLHSYNLVHISYHIVIVIAIVFLLICSFMTVIPIKNLAKKKTIEVINGEYAAG